METRTGAKFKAGEAVVLAALQHVAAPVHVQDGDEDDAEVAGEQ